MLTTIVFILTLSTLILVHELGHFLAAKKAGIKVEEFGFGYPPRILAVKIGETFYSLNWILFGGFVKLFGEELEEAERQKDKRSKIAFWSKSKKARAGVILSGVLANFLLGIFLFSLVYSVSGIPRETGRVRIVGVAAGSPAGEVGLKEGDLVLAVDGEKISSNTAAGKKGLEQFVELINQKKGTLVQLTVAREKENPCLEKVVEGSLVPLKKFNCQDGNLVFLITPRTDSPEGEGALGILVSSIEMKKYPFWQMPFLGAIEGLKGALVWANLILVSLSQMIKDLLFRGIAPSGVAGPVGIFQITGTVVQAGILNVLRFVGILSVNLSIINVLPFPALDGGRLVFVLYEAVTRRRPQPGFEHWINAAGMTVLLALIILVTINDVDRMVDLSGLWVRLKSSF